MDDSASERLKNYRQKVEEATDRAMREIEESGELRHMHGKPLNLDDDPEWLVTRTLKEQGFSHPFIEMAKELEQPRQKAESIIQRLQRRRQHLASRGSLDAASVAGFNEGRASELAAYRRALSDLKRAIRDYNLQAPSALHQRPLLIDDALAAAERDVPELVPSDAAGAVQVSPTKGFRRRLRLKL